MRNLAGNPHCDTFIAEELSIAGIHIVRVERSTNEVAARLIGKLGSLTFRRAWYYWVVSGDVPLIAAKELYKNSVGGQDIRVNGFSGGGVAPENPFVEWRNKDGKIILSLEEKKKYEGYVNDPHPGMSDVGRELLEKHVFAEDPSAVGEGFITSYHIDSQEGLNLFVQTMKKHNLIT